jgi:hypothetical protein
MDGQDGILVGRHCRDDEQRIAEGPDGRLRQALQPPRMLGVRRIDMRRRWDDGEGDTGLECDRRPPFLVERGWMADGFSPAVDPPLDRPTLRQAVDAHQPNYVEVARRRPCRFLY